MSAEIGEMAGYMLVEKSPAGIWHLISTTRYPTITAAIAALKADTDNHTVTIPVGVAKLSLVMIQYPEEP